MTKPREDMYIEQMYQEDPFKRRESLKRTPPLRASPENSVDEVSEKTPMDNETDVNTDTDDLLRIFLGENGNSIEELKMEAKTKNVDGKPNPKRRKRKDGSAQEITFITPTEGSYEKIKKGTNKLKKEIQKLLDLVKEHTNTKVEIKKNSRSLDNLMGGSIHIINECEKEDKHREEERLEREPMETEQKKNGGQGDTGKPGNGTRGRDRNTFAENKK